MFQEGGVIPGKKVGEDNIPFLINPDEIPYVTKEQYDKVMTAIRRQRQMANRTKPTKFSTLLKDLAEAMHAFTQATIQLGEASKRLKAATDKANEMEKEDAK